MATIENYVCELLGLVEATSNNKFGNVCNRKFDRTAYYRQIKNCTLSYTIMKNCFKSKPSPMNERVVNQQKIEMCDACKN